MTLQRERASFHAHRPNATTFTIYLGRASNAFPTLEAYSSAPLTADEVQQPGLLHNGLFQSLLVRSREAPEPCPSITKRLPR